MVIHLRFLRLIWIHLRQLLKIRDVSNLYGVRNHRDTAHPMRSLLSITALLSQSSIQLADATRVMVRNINLYRAVTEKHIQCLQTSLYQCSHISIVVECNLIKQMNTITTISTDRFLKAKLLEGQVNLITKRMSSCQFLFR